MMEDKMIVEVGSTCTKIDFVQAGKIERLSDNAIEFKKHYKEDNQLRETDIRTLIEEVNGLKKFTNEIYVYGTSIFRILEEKQKEEFLDRFKTETGYDFNIVSQEEESKLTVLGATRFVKNKVCIFNGGGGSTEITIYDKEIKEVVNTKLGVVDVLQEFPDLAENYATTDIEKVKNYIKLKLNLPKEKADILILTGGGHEKFARYSGIKYEDNNLYRDTKAPIMMDIHTRITETTKYYKSISLDEIRNKDTNPRWWDATRAMCAFVLVVAETIGARYIVPTDVTMVYGISKFLKKN